MKTLTSSPLRDSIARSIRYQRRHQRSSRPEATNRRLVHAYHACLIKIAVELEGMPYNLQSLQMIDNDKQNWNKIGTQPYYL